MVDALGFELTLNTFGQLVLNKPGLPPWIGVIPVRAFPLTAPEEGLSLVTSSGEEVLWISHLTDLPEAMREIVEAELASREFMPEIQAIRSVSSYATPCTWRVSTIQGETELVLKGEEDIRRLHLYGNGIQSLIIRDRHGIEYFVPNRNALDRHSRKLLDRFL